MKIKYPLATLTTLLCTHAFAQQPFLPPGSNLTYGSSSNNQSLMSSVANPAAAAAVLGQEDSQYRFGLISIGAGYEIGNVSDLFNQIDSTQKKLTTAQNVTVTPTTTAADVALYVNTNIVNPVNSLTSAFQKDGTFTAFASAHVPFTPFVISKKAWGGSFVLDANVSAVANMSFLADPILVVSATDQAVVDAVTPTSPTFGTYKLPANDSALLVKAAVVKQIGLGYSRSVLKREAPAAADGQAASGMASAGELTAGARVKFYQIDLVRDAQKLTNSTGAQNTFDASKVYNSSSSFGLDVGTLWNSQNYRVGAWVNNLNTPKFQYNTISTTGYTNPTIAAQLNADGVYEMKPQVQLEGALFTTSQNWVLNVAVDANAVKDPVGRDFQWTTVSAAYATNSWWIPGLRLGYRSNGAGTQLKYMTGGLTLFKALSLDVAVSTDSVTDDKGNTAPRSFMANLGLQLTF